MHAGSVIRVGPIELRVGEHSPGLAQLMQDTGTECCAFLKSEHYADLCSAVRDYVYYPGVYVSGALAVRGVLLMGQEYPATAYLLARKFNQPDFVWCAENAVPELLLTGDYETEKRLTTTAYRQARGG